jgi:hypothetical protein
MSVRVMGVPWHSLPLPPPLPLTGPLHPTVAHHACIHTTKAFTAQVCATLQLILRILGVGVPTEALALSLFSVRLRTDLLQSVKSVSREDGQAGMCSALMVRTASNALVQFYRRGHRGAAKVGGS